MSRLIVKNLPSNLEENEIRKKFESFGVITDCKIIKRKGKSRRFAFIGFKTEKIAQNAMKKMQSCLIKNQKVLIESCRKFSCNENKNENMKNNEGRNQIEGKTKKEGFWLKMRGCPFNVTKKNIEEFFFPTKIEEIEILKNQNGNTSGFVLVKFQNKKEQEEAMKNDKSYIKGRYIDLKLLNTSSFAASQPSVTSSSRLETTESIEEGVCETGRLFVRNLCFDCKEEDLREAFEQFGDVSEIQLIIDPNQPSKNLGYAHITYMIPENAIRAMQQLDGDVFQGRMLHVLPGKLKREDVTSNDVTRDQLSSFKKEKAKEMTKNAEKSVNWNTLFISPSAVADVIAARYGASKRDVSESTSTHSAAVKMALGESEIVAETRDFLLKNGVHLDAFGNAASARSKNVIIAKNLPTETSSGELRKLFGGFGKLGRVLIAPAATTAIIEFVTSSSAKKALLKLAYRSFHHTPLYLEWAPSDVFTKPEVTSSDDTPSKMPPSSDTSSKMTSFKNTATLFVKNLNFETTESGLKELFESTGRVVDVVISRKHDLRRGTSLSMGYGFVELASGDDALLCLQKLQGADLDGHKLELKKSEKKGLSEGSRRNLQKEEDADGRSKILVRNIPFQAKQDEIQSLFSSFGDLKSVRLPTRATLASSGASHNHRGFAFVDFINVENAKLAFQTLCNSTHLYGRRLVLEWANSDQSENESLKRKANSEFEKVMTSYKREKSDIEDILYSNAAEMSD